MESLTSNPELENSLGRLQAWSNLVQSVRFTADRGHWWRQSKPIFLSVCIPADQVGELVQVGYHGIGSDRSVIGAGSK